MGYLLLNFFRPLFECIEQKEIDQDRIDFCFGMRPLNLTDDQFHGPNATATQLDFPAVARLDGQSLADTAVEWGTVG